MPKTISIRSAVSIEHRLETDRQTPGHSIYCAICVAYASRVKTEGKISRDKLVDLQLCLSELTRNIDRYIKPSATGNCVEVNSFDLYCYLE